MRSVGLIAAAFLCAAVLMSGCRKEEEAAKPPPPAADPGWPTQSVQDAAVAFDLDESGFHIMRARLAAPGTFGAPADITQAQKLAARAYDMQSDNPEAVARVNHLMVDAGPRVTWTLDNPPNSAWAVRARPGVAMVGDQAPDTQVCSAYMKMTPHGPEYRTLWGNPPSRRCEGYSELTGRRCPNMTTRPKDSSGKVYCQVHRTQGDRDTTAASPVSVGGAAAGGAAGGMGGGMPGGMGGGMPGGMGGGMSGGMAPGGMGSGPPGGMGGAPGGGGGAAKGGSAKSDEGGSKAGAKASSKKESSGED